MKMLALLLSLLAQDEQVVFIASSQPLEKAAIHVMGLDPKTGALTPRSKGTGLENPNFLALHPNGKFLYATGGAGQNGLVGAFSIDPKTAALTFLGAESAGGAGPCHLVVDRTGKNVLVANYGAGSVACLPIGEDGRLKPASVVIQHQGGSGVLKPKQDKPHAHSINLDAANKLAYVADLGMDKILIYAFDAEKGTLTPHDPPHVATPPGSGPRHFAFHPAGPFAYANGEFDSTVISYAYDAAKGTLKQTGVRSTLPAPVEKNTTAEVTATNAHVYVSNRGHDSIAVFTVNEKTGELTPAGHVPTGGKLPRHFGIDPTGAWLLACNVNSDSVTVFRLKDGKPEPTGRSVPVEKAICVRFAGGK